MSVAAFEFFALRPVGRRVPGWLRLFSSPMANSCWSSRGAHSLLPIHFDRLWPYASCIRARVQRNYNHNHNHINHNITTTLQQHYNNITKIFSQHYNNISTTLQQHYNNITTTLQKHYKKHQQYKSKNKNKNKNKTEEEEEKEEEEEGRRKKKNQHHYTTTTLHRTPHNTGVLTQAAGRVLWPRRRNVSV